MQTLKCACAPTPGMLCSWNDNISIANAAVCCLQYQYKMFKTTDQPAKADCEIWSVIRFLIASNLTIWCLEFFDAWQCQTPIHDSYSKSDRSFGWVQNQPPTVYSTDFWPSDYHLLHYLKQFLGGKRFTTDDEMKEAVKNITGYLHRWQTSTT